MSVDDAQEFLLQMSGDGKLAAQIKDAAGDAARLALAKAAGYNFTLDELEAVRDGLDDAMLSEVAGGLMDNQPETPQAGYPYMPGGSCWQIGECKDSHQKDEIG